VKNVKLLPSGTPPEEPLPKGSNFTDHLLSVTPPPQFSSSSFRRLVVIVVTQWRESRALRREIVGEKISFTAAAVSIEPVEIPSPRISEADDCGGRLDFRKAFFVGF
uniref:hypothetical protein n=9 Tax=Vibrio cholerae TaxID=666 RepID=UPI001969866F